MKTKSKNNSVSYFDMQFITSSISTTLVLLLLGLVVFFVLTAFCVCKGEYQFLYYHQR